MKTLTLSIITRAKKQLDLPLSHKSKILSGFIFVGLCTTVVMTLGCATSPTGRKQLMFIPEEKVDQLGVQSFEEMKAKEPVNHDPKLNAYIKCVANAVTDALPEKKQWEVVVFETKEANAFALPGGKIGVNVGLLDVATTPAQLATVIGHEIGHVLAKHGNERLSDQFVERGGERALDLLFTNKDSALHGVAAAALGGVMQYGFNLPYSRAQETEADIIGLDLMSKAGFDPAESTDLWKNMIRRGGNQPPQFMSDHPVHENRIATLNDHMSSARSNFAQASRHPHCTK